MKRKVTIDFFFPPGKSSKTNKDEISSTEQCSQAPVETVSIRPLADQSSSPALHFTNWDICDFASASSLNPEQRNHILTHNWSLPATFPSRKIGNKNRSFVPSWINEFDGLVYSAKTDGAFCKYCVAFPCDPDNKRGALVKMPFTNWKDAKEKFNKHFHCEAPSLQTKKNGGKGYGAHINSKVKAGTFLEAYNNGVDIVCKIDVALEKRLEKNKKIIESVAKTVLLCGRQNLAFRGHRDDSKYTKLNTNNTGNFQALLDFRVDSGDEILKEHFQTAPNNATYRSKTIQNELISVIGGHIQKTIVDEINKAGGWFSVSADEVQDTSNKEQLAICVRYTSTDGIVHERLVALQDVSGDTTGAALSDEILQVITDIGLDPAKMRSQCYDGAGNMMGKVKGVAARIQNQYPKALPFWCTSHLLNRCIVAACDVKDLKNMMGIADKCVSFFNNSSKRQTYLEQELSHVENAGKRTKLKELCRTRWVQRHDAFEVFLDFYPAIIDALNAILESEKRPDAVTDTNGILHAITNFSFIVTLIVVLRCLAYIKSLSIALQERAMDVVQAMKEVGTVQATLEMKRQTVDEFHTQLFKEAVTVGQSVGVEASMPRLCGRQTARTNTPAASPIDYYRRTITVPFLDHLLQQFKERFSNLQLKAAMAFKLAPPIPDDLTVADLEFFSDLPSQSSLQAEIDTWRLKCEQAEKAPKSLAEALTQCPVSMYPNIHTVLRIALTLPVTSCECERSISTLGAVKSDTRSTMGQERLTGLCLMSVHRDIDIDINKIVMDFTRLHPRKMKLPNILNCDGQ